MLKWMFWKKRRVLVAISAFFGLFIVYALRTSFNVAIIAMTSNKIRVLDNITITEDPDFNCSSELKGYIISCFFYGYIATPVLGGWLSAKIGGKNLFGFAIAISGILNLLTPLSLRISVYLLIAVRIAEGTFQGLNHPSLNTVWSKWAPPLERTNLVTISMSGNHVGTAVSMAVSAWLTDTYGWPSVFYVFGVISMLWFIIWMYFVSEEPKDDPRISVHELQYIQQSIGSHLSTHKVKTPWRDILTSLPVWAIVIATLADGWSYYLFLTELPTYLKDKFNYDLTKSGLLSGLPYLVKTVANLLAGQLADWLLQKRIFRIIQVRKIFTSGFFVAQAILLIVASHLSSPLGTMICLTSGIALGVCSYSGFGVNCLDVAPRHAGVIIGLGNTAGVLIGIFNTILTGYIVNAGLPEQWQIVLYLAGGVLLFGAVVYCLFASGEVQSWNVEAIPLQNLTSHLYSITNEDESTQRK